MTTPTELDLYWSFTARSVNRIVDCLDGLNSEQLNWQPYANGSSLYTLAIHMMGNMAEVILGLLCGQAVQRDRDAEFATVGESAESVRAQWAALQEHIEKSLLALGDDMLDQPFTHPRRGQMSGRAILMVVMRHAAEHMGHAELTRDLLYANLPAPN